MTGTLRILVVSAGACRTVGGESRGARAVAFLTHKQGDLRGKAEPAPSAVLTSVFGEQHHPEEFDVRFGSEADILGGLRDVSFTPESRHKSWPKLRSAHQLRQQGDGLIASGCMVALPAQINNKSDEAQ